MDPQQRTNPRKNNEKSSSHNLVEATNTLNELDGTISLTVDRQSEGSRSRTSAVDLKVHTSQGRPGPSRFAKSHQVADSVFSHSNFSTTMKDKRSQFRFN